MIFVCLPCTIAQVVRCRFPQLKAPLARLSTTRLQGMPGISRRRCKRARCMEMHSRGFRPCTNLCEDHLRARLRVWQSRSWRTRQWLVKNAGHKQTDAFLRLPSAVRVFVTRARFDTWCFFSDCHGSPYVFFLQCRVVPGHRQLEVTRRFSSISHMYSTTAV